MVFIRGLWHEQANNGIIHCMQTGNILSGSVMDKQSVRTGISFDQVMAKKIGDRTRIPSLVLGCEEATPGLQDGHPLLYGSHISWSTSVSPSWMETNPARAFDYLFDNKRQQNDTMAIDRILDDAKLLEKKLSTSDKQRFNEYLTSIYEIEKRIEGLNKPLNLNEPLPSRPEEKIPNNIPEYWQLMNDILILAFRTDCTRIATLKYCNDASALVHSHINKINDNHHYLSHTEPTSLIMLNQFFISQLAYLCEKMSNIQEGENTLLDNTSIMHCSSMLHGNHDSKQLPVILLGGAGGFLKGGRVLDYTDSFNRRMCSLFLSLMDWAGLELNNFGDAKDRLIGL